MFYKLAQFVGHGWVLNLFFGSLQTDKWLQRYGHFKVSGWMACQVCTQGTLSCPVCTNVSQSAQDTRHSFIATRGWSDDHIIPAGAMQFCWDARGKPGSCHGYQFHRGDASSSLVPVPSSKGCSAAHPQYSLRICGFETHHDAWKPRAAVLISFGTNGALHVSNSVNSMVSVTQHHMLCFAYTPVKI